MPERGQSPQVDRLANGCQNKTYLIDLVRLRARLEAWLQAPGKGDEVPKALNDAVLARVRDRLCHAAECLLAGGGPGAVSMRAVAAKLEVSSMTPYRYFESKEAMMNAVRVRGFERLAKVLEAANDTGGAIEPSARLGEAYVTFASEHAAVYRVMFEAWQAADLTDSELVIAVARVRSALASGGARVLKARSSARDAALVGDFFWATLHGGLALEMAGKISPAVDADRRPAAVLNVIVRGLADGLVEA